MRQLTVPVAGLVLSSAALVAAGVLLGAVLTHRAAPEAPAHEHRDFIFEVTDLKTPNQGGQTVNLFFRYRYDSGIAEKDIPNYLSLRKAAVDDLGSADLSRSPYWETLNQHLCTRLKSTFPVEAISCELQVHGQDVPGPHYEPGYHASVETIGDITPLAVPGPP